MPFRHFAILLAVVIAAAAVTIWIASLVFGPGLTAPSALLVVIPIALVLAYLVRRLR